MNTAAPITRASIVRIVWQAALPKGCGKAKVVLACLAWHAVLSESDQCWPHVETIARLCGLKRRATMNHLEALAQAGLITSTKRAGTSSVYRLNRAALVALSSEMLAADYADMGAENASEGAENDRVGAENARKLAFSAPIRKKEEREKEEGREREGNACAPNAALVAEPTFPLLPIFEDLKTEQPKTAVDDVLAGIADKRAAGLPIGGQQIRDLIEAAAASGEVPIEVAADAVRGCLPAGAVPVLAEPAGLATPAEPVIAPAAPAQPAPAVAIAPDTLAAVNAQRVRNGKTEFKPADLQDLHREATLAGIAPQAAAEWILAKPARSFFKADYHKPLTAGVVSAPAAPIDEAAKAKARAKADQVQAELVRRSIEAMRQGPAASVMLPASAAPITRPALRPAVTLRHAAPTALGSTGTGWARQAVDGFLAGEPVSHAKLTNAAAALGLAVRDLKAQRAALSGVAA